MTKVFEDVLWEFFLCHIVDLELNTPFERVDEHLLRVLDVEFPKMRNIRDKD